MASDDSSFSSSSDYLGNPFPPGRITASRLMTSVRRSLIHPAPPRRRNSDKPTSGMYSTAAERLSYSPPRFRDVDGTRPTIEQIAMGLHVSRTPHLRPAPKHHHHHPPSAYYASLSQDPRHPQRDPHHPARHTLQTRPPPPLRSSLKKSSASSAGSAPPHPAPPSASSQSTLAPPAPRAGPSLRLRIQRLLPAPLAPAAPRLHPVLELPPPKKAVRFDEQALPPRIGD